MYSETAYMSFSLSHDQKTSVLIPELNAKFKYSKDPVKLREDKIWQNTYFHVQRQAIYKETYHVHF